MRRVIIFSRVVCRPLLTYSLLAQDAASRGAGNVVKSFAVCLLILLQDNALKAHARLTMIRVVAASPTLA